MLWVTTLDLGGVLDFINSNASVISIGLGFVGGVLALLQLRATQRAQLDSSAREMWKDYLHLCVKYPKFADAEIAESDPEYDRYAWFVAVMLDSVEGLLLHAYDGHLWKKSLEAEINRHRDFLNAGDFKSRDLQLYSKKMRKFVRAVLESPSQK